jgi:hypothetical protein
MEDALPSPQNSNSQLTFTGIMFKITTATRKTDIHIAGFVFMPVAQLMKVRSSAYWNRMADATVTI